MKIRTLPLAIAGALTVPTAVHAVKYKLSGQVNRAIVYQNDGENSQTRNVDASTSGTRFRLRGSEDLGNGVQVGFYWELQTQSADSFFAAPTQNAAPVFDLNTGGDLRQANVFFATRLGTLTIGQTHGAGDGATEVDLSGTTTSVYHGRTSFTAGMAWRTSGGAALRDPAPGSFTADGGATDVRGNTLLSGTADAGSVITAGDTFNEYDGFSRYDAIRYDSPALGPVVLSASIGNSSLWEVAGRLRTALAGGTLSAALFYGQDYGQTPLDNKRYGGSASYLFSQGTNITAAYARQEQQAAGGTNSDVYTIKLGQKWGPHAVAVQYSVGDDVTPGFHDTGYGIGYNFSLKKAKTDIYAAYMFTELDTPTGVPSAEDQRVALIGARVRFD